MKPKPNLRIVTRLKVVLVAGSLVFSIQTEGADTSVADAPANTPKPPELTARQNLMSQFDLDKNGKLEPAEREAYLKHLEDERKKFIQQFDKNGDGLLDEEERNAARAFAFQKKLEKKAAAKAGLQPKDSPASANPSK